MVSTGVLHKDSLGDSWFIEYKCEVSGEEILTWDEKYESLIQEIIKEEGIVD